MGLGQSSMLCREVNNSRQGLEARPAVPTSAASPGFTTAGHQQVAGELWGALTCRPHGPGCRSHKGPRSGSNTGDRRDVGERRAKRLGGAEWACGASQQSLPLASAQRRHSRPRAPPGGQPRPGEAGPGHRFPRRLQYPLQLGTSGQTTGQGQSDLALCSVHQ